MYVPTIMTFAGNPQRKRALARENLQRATKRAFRAARASGKPIGWREARRRGQTWCLAMNHYGTVA